MFECVECGAAIEPETRLRIGDILECPECSTELEVVDTDPLSVEAVSQDDEDEALADSENLDEEEWLR